MKNDSNLDYVNMHEQRLSRGESRLTEIEARADYKDEIIDKIESKVTDMDKKLDGIANSLNQLQLQSVKDDQHIDKRVTSLETTVNVLKWLITLLLSSGGLALLAKLATVI